MLLGNYTPLSANPGRCVTHALPNPYKWRSSGNVYSFYTGDAVVSGETKKSSFNNGYIPPYSWILAPKAGGIASINMALGAGEMTSSMAMGKNAEATLAGVGTIDTASLSMVVSMLANLAGSGSLTSSMVGVVQMVASLVGEGNLEGSLGLLANLISDMVGSGVISADLKGKLYMASNIYVNQSEATVEQIVYAVWNALASEYNNSGTMGNKLNGAGSAGDPWTTDLSSYNTAGTAGKKLKDLKTPILVDDGIVISQ